MGKKTVRVLAVGAVAAGAALAAIGAKLYRTTTFREPQEVQAPERLIPAEVRHIRSMDGLALYGDVYPAAKPSHRWAIVIHGYRGDASGMEEAVKLYHDHGFNVLAPDCRGHGRSEGKYIGMGWHDRLDMLMWIDLLVSEDPMAQIVLHGISMGGATVMMTAGETLPPQVKCAVEDCGYSSIVEEYDFQLYQMGHPYFHGLFMRTLDACCRRRAGYSIYDGDAVRQLRKSRLPMLFIHGEADDFVPFSMVGKVFEAHGGEKELYTVPGAGHGLAFATDRRAYEERLCAFLDRYLTDEN